MHLLLVGYVQGMAIMRVVIIVSDPRSSVTKEWIISDVGRLQLIIPISEGGLRVSVGSS